MTKINYIEFIGFDRFKENIKIDLSEGMVSLVGANGSGKSTILEAIATVFHFLKKYNIQGSVKNVIEGLKLKRTTNPIWESATIQFSLDPEQNPDTNKLLNDLFKVTIKNNFKFKIIKHPNNKQIFLLETVILDDKIIFDIDTEGEDYIVDSKRLEELKGKVEDETKQRQTRTTELQQKQKEYNNEGNQTHLNILQKEITELSSKISTLNKESNDRIAEINNEIKLHEKSDILLKNGKQVNKEKFEKLLTSFKIPESLYIKGNDDPNQFISNFMGKMKSLKHERGSEREISSYSIIKNNLSDFLNSEVDFSGPDDNFKIHIDALTIDKLSLGTYLGLGFFSIENAFEDIGIIIWDEPENSMHPARRNKICSLMKNSEVPFLVATHTTEFAPLFSGCIVYKLISKFIYGEMEQAECELLPASSLLDAFKITKILGLEPSKVLFTSNCIIWVEGPSDVIYFRFWLKKYIEKNILNLIEGFDYSFCMTSGSILSYYSLDNPNIKDDAELDAAIINVLTLTQNSIFIVDTDIDKSAITEKEEKEYDKDKIDDKKILCEKIINKLKPRVEKLATAIKKNDINTMLLTTYGRETENYIENNEFKNILKLFYTVESDSSESKIIDKIIIKRWDSFISQIEDTLLNPEIKNNTFEYKDKDGKEKLKKLGDLQHKVNLALKYVEYYQDKQFDLNKMLNDKGQDINLIINKIQKIKKEYFQ